MLEKVVLILAVIGVWSVGGDDAERRRRFARPYDALIFLLQGFSCLRAVIGFMSSGRRRGGSRACALLAAMWMVAMMAGSSNRRIDANGAHGPIAGPSVFASSSAIVDDGYFAYPPVAKPVILAIERHSWCSPSPWRWRLLVRRPAIAGRAVNSATLAALVSEPRLSSWGCTAGRQSAHPLASFSPSTWWAAAFRLPNGGAPRLAAGLAFDLFRKRWSLHGHCRGVRRERARGRAGAASVPDRAGASISIRTRGRGPATTGPKSQSDPLAHDAGRLAARHRDPPACCRDHSVVRSRRTPCTAHRRILATCGGALACVIAMETARAGKPLVYAIGGLSPPLGIAFTRRRRRRNDAGRRPDCYRFRSISGRLA